ncbi:hypothetical protein ABID19_002457 [Mesorhizobium robiniae]|uniref:Uncharacterized protein n=1 Tax=Mesorhizobium robiniae TaxID=559315 RepID=A0ABV2GMA3_9HYPH
MALIEIAVDRQDALILDGELETMVRRAAALLQAV